ncbi:alternate gene name: yzbB [Yersinia frederiksenii]|nr:alternate gene name: yzbB [Yersinia frederiksenii]
MRYFLQKLLCLCLLFMINASYADVSQKIILGVDQENVYGPLLKNKRVGLMVNQSSINREGRHTIDKLLSEQDKFHFTITTLFSVEHGIRGNADAGLGDDNHIDKQSGLPIISLYGRDKDGRVRAHPTEAQLSDVDVVIYDLQDVGVRYFTYTISMHHMLESLQKYHKQFMVFDRPNPLGNYVYGPILEEENISGIGMHPVPMVHGLTSGEFARMIVNEGWLTHFDDASWKAFGIKAYQFPPEDLAVIAMGNYTHESPYSLPVRPSPNLRSDLAIHLYPSLGIFEATSVNMGRGSDHPFEQLGFPSKKFYINTCYDVDINQQKTGWPHAGKEVCGERFSVTDMANIPPTIRYFVEWWFKFKDAGYSMVIPPQMEANYLDYQDEYFLIRPLWLAKLTGTRNLVKLMEAATERKLTIDETVDYLESNWQPGINNYLKLREKYKLYP